MFRENVYRSGPGQSGTVMEALYCFDGIFIGFHGFFIVDNSCRIFGILAFSRFHVVDTTTTWMGQPRDRRNFRLVNIILTWVGSLFGDLDWSKLETSSYVYKGLKKFINY